MRKWGLRVGIHSRVQDTYVKMSYVMQYRVEWIQTNGKVNTSFKMYLD